MERQQPHQVQVHPASRYEGLGGYKGGLQQQRGPAVSKILAVMTLLPVGGGLLAVSGFTLFGTLVGLAFATPVFIFFSPVIVPAAFVLGFAVNSFLTSGALGLTGLTSLSWVMNYLRQAGRAMPEQLDQARRRMQDMAGFVGQKTREVGQEIQKKAQEGK